jgi:hypothetical protein
MKTVTVIIRKKHWQAALDASRIRNGEIQIESSKCPIAQALRDRFPDDQYIRVEGGETPYVRLAHGTYDMNKAGAALVEAFDSQEWDDQDWTQAKPQGKPAFPEGKRMPKLPAKAVLKLREEA